ncbi:MAG: DUF763 domain-containing protein [Spirochaetales bacterium]|nr:DUF763 domain-containing protein [Spirochaetales bacterium]
MKRSGSADLPLHYGTIPPWLADRMMKLGTAMVEAVIADAGTDEVLRRLSDPCWFQAFGAVLGMDWHSSGITTSVMRAIQRGINPRSKELGLAVLGGRGKYSRQTPQELIEYSMKTGLSGDELTRVSRLTAKIDNSCLQDGFQIYLHNFIITEDGKWAVVQQGMNKQTGTARRYHWHSEGLRSFFDDPHAAVVGPFQGELVNLSDSRAEQNRSGILEFMNEYPERQQRELDSLLRSRRIVLPSHHEVKPEDVISKRLGAVLSAAWDKNFSDFSEALLMQGVGPRTVQSLALVSEVIYGGPSRFTDPARFSFAHGGKDGHPAPVPLKVYDKSISVVKRALEDAKTDKAGKLSGIKNLDRFTRWIESTVAPDADVDEVIAHEWENSHRWGGQTVMGRAVPGDSYEKHSLRYQGSSGRTKSPVPARSVQNDDNRQMELFD